MELDEVVLEIEGTSVKCSKKELIENSDYFKVMFEGNFLERNKSRIKLEGIDLKSMETILTCLRVEMRLINETEILTLLQTAFVLQFNRILELCVEFLTEMLVPDNCITIWFAAELLNLKPLFLKAKSLALLEFDAIKDTDCLLELNLMQLHRYLSNSLLRCSCELDVFNVCRRWYCEQDKQEETLGSLLRCLDFTRLKDDDINVIMNFLNVRDDAFLMDVLNCLIDLRNCNEVEKYDETVISEGRILYECRSRVKVIPVYPMFFVANMSKGQSDNLDAYCDTYKRSKLDDLVKIRNAGSIIAFNKKTHNFTHYLDVSKEKYRGHEDFHLVGHEGQIFLLGGKLSWANCYSRPKFWVGDALGEHWELKPNKLPHGKSPYQTLICGNSMYVYYGIGGDNILWYNFKSNVWSKQMVLPTDRNLLKCCNYNDQLFLLNIKHRCGYFPRSKWKTLNISDTNNLMPNYPDYLDCFTLFAFGSSIFIKGSSLIELEVTENSLNVINTRYLGPVNCYSMTSVICKDTVYTLYKYNESKTITVEMLSMDTYEITYLFQDLSEDSTTTLCDGKFQFGMWTKLFALPHYQMAESDVYVNNL